MSASRCTTWVLISSMRWSRSALPPMVNAAANSSVATEDTE
ncbi:Uncharacterised protein [Mycobacterium tuberculosis]|nr:Uncharacterised protein [Mycobacterium tuberculosis]COZ82238.1 Uncharacterised protein [Mycobacterium tuberculosis]